MHWTVCVSGRQWCAGLFLMCVCQTAVCSGVPVVCWGEGECSEEEDKEWEKASLCSSSTLLWSSALRFNRSFRVWCTGTWNTHPTVTVLVTKAFLYKGNSKVDPERYNFLHLLGRLHWQTNIQVWTGPTYSRLLVCLNTEWIIRATIWEQIWDFKNTVIFWEKNVVR